MSAYKSTGTGAVRGHYSGNNNMMLAGSEVNRMDGNTGHGNANDGNDDDNNGQQEDVHVLCDERLLPDILFVLNADENYLLSRFHALPVKRDGAISESGAGIANINNTAMNMNENNTMTSNTNSTNNNRVYTKPDIKGNDMISANKNNSVKNNSSNNNNTNTSKYIHNNKIHSTVDTAQQLASCVTGNNDNISTDSLSHIIQNDVSNSGKVDNDLNKLYTALHKFQSEFQSGKYGVIDFFRNATTAKGGVCVGGRQTKITYYNVAETQPLIPQLMSNSPSSSHKGNNAKKSKTAAYKANVYASSQASPLIRTAQQVIGPVHTLGVTPFEIYEQ